MSKQYTNISINNNCYMYYLIKNIRPTENCLNIEHVSSNPFLAFPRKSATLILIFIRFI